MKGYHVTFFLGLFSVSSCVVGESQMCDLEKTYYIQKWDFTVKRSYRDRNHKATYIIETDDKKILYFAPKQWLNTMAEPGDRVIKKRKSAHAFLITKDHDTLESRIYSPTCNKLVTINE